MMIGELPECDDGYLLNALKMVGRDFCIGTEAWIEELAPINVLAGTTTYRLVVKQEGSVHRIKKVVMNDLDVDLRLVSLSANGRDLILDDSIEPTAAATNGLVVTIVVRPHFSATAYPEWFLDRYSEALMAGTLSKLMLEPKKPWTNPERGIMYRDLYSEKKSLARREIDAEHKSVDITMTFQPFI
jgi:hypothetical protein